MAKEWMVAAVLVFAGLIAAVGLLWGLRDPITRRYKPGVGGLFFIGRRILRPEFDEERDKDKKDTNGGGPGPSKS